MRFKHWILFAIIILTSTSAHAQSVRTIKDANMQLDKLIDSDKFDLRQGIEIIDSKQGSEIRKQYTEDNYDSIEPRIDLVNFSLNAFIKWCSYFLKKKRDYVVFQTPLEWLLPCYDKTPLAMTASGDTSSTNRKIVDVNPIYQQTPINNLLNEKNVILLVGTTDKIYSYDFFIHLTAIIPYGGNYYRYDADYVFQTQVDFKFWGSTDINKVCNKIADMIETNPDRLVTPVLQSNNFNPNYEGAPRDFTGIKNITLKQTDINPDNGKITVYSLFGLDSPR